MSVACVLSSNWIKPQTERCLWCCFLTQDEVNKRELNYQSAPLQEIPFGSIGWVCAERLPVKTSASTACLVLLLNSGLSNQKGKELPECMYTWDLVAQLDECVLCLGRFLVQTSATAMPLVLLSNSRLSKQKGKEFPSINLPRDPMAQLDEQVFRVQRLLVQTSDSVVFLVLLFTETQVNKREKNY